MPWSLEPIVDNRHAVNGTKPSSFKGLDGNIHVFYYDQATIRHGTLNPTTGWAFENFAVISVGGVSAAQDASGYIYVITAGVALRNLSTFNGTTWSTVSLGLTGGSMYSRANTTSDGVVYYHNTGAGSGFNQLWVDSWLTGIKTRVYTGPSIYSPGFLASDQITSTMLVAQNGNLNFWRNLSDNLLYHFERVAGTWVTTQVSNISFRRLTLYALQTADGTQHLIGMDAPTGSVYRIYGTPGAWTVEIVDGTLVSTGISHLEAFVDVEDNIQVFYYDNSFTQLKQATFDGTSWVFISVDNQGSVGQYVTATFDGISLHAFYGDATNSALYHSKFSKPLNVKSINISRQKPPVGVANDQSSWQSDGLVSWVSFQEGTGAPYTQNRGSLDATTTTGNIPWVGTEYGIGMRTQGGASITSLITNAPSGLDAFTLSAIIDLQDSTVDANILNYGGGATTSLDLKYVAAIQSYVLTVNGRELKYRPDSIGLVHIAIVRPQGATIDNHQLWVDGVQRTLKPIAGIDQTVSYGAVTSVKLLTNFTYTGAGNVAIVDFRVYNYAWNNSQVEAWHNDAYEIYEPAWIPFVIPPIQSNMEVYGSNMLVADGDMLPTVVDGTDFRVLDVAAGTVDHTFYIRNTGDLALSLAGPSPVTFDNNNTELTVISQPVLTPITKGQAFQVPFVVRYDATVRGYLEVPMSIASNDLSSPYTFAVSTTGESSLIAITGNNNAIANGSTLPALPNHTDYTANVAGVDTTTRTYKIANNGERILNISSVSLTGSTDFTITTLPSMSVSAGGFTTFQVTFSPTSKGIISGAVVVLSDGFGDATYSYDIQGVGLAPAIGITGQQVNLQMVAGDNAIISVPLLITNIGDSILNLMVDTGGSNWVVATPSIAALNTGTSVSVVFTLSALGVTVGNHVSTIVFKDSNGLAAQVTRVFNLDAVKGVKIKQGERYGLGIVSKESTTNVINTENFKRG